MCALTLLLLVASSSRRNPVPPPIAAPAPVVPEAVVENTPIFPESRALYRTPMYNQSNLQTSYVLKLPSVVSDRDSLIRLNDSHLWITKAPASGVSMICWSVCLLVYFVGHCIIASNWQLKLFAQNLHNDNCIHFFAFVVPWHIFIWM